MVHSLIVFLWFILPQNLCISLLSGNKSLSHYKYIVGAWDDELVVLYEDVNELKLHTTSLTSDCDEWKIMQQSTSMHAQNHIIDALQITNTNLIFMMHTSYTSFYDLNIHKTSEQYAYAPHLQMNTNENIVCLTMNALENVLYFVTFDSLLSFSVISQKWSENIGNHIMMHRIASGCALDDSYSFIYIFGGRSDTEYVNTIIKYETTIGKWDVLSNVVISQQSDHIKCGLLLSHKNIYCVTGNILYIFNPSQDIMIHESISQHMQYHAIHPWKDSKIILIGSNSTDSSDDIQYMVRCSVSEKKSVQSCNHRRNLGTLPIITLNSTYTQNITLEHDNMYVVNSDVLFSWLIVPDNVTILFNGSYTIEITGSLFMGSCVNDATIGVSSNPIHVYNTDPSSPGGLLHVTASNNIVSICNTNFSYIQGIKITGTSDIVLDNLEFHHVTCAIYIYKSTASQMVSDSYFDHCEQGFNVYSGDGGGVIQRNIFNLVVEPITTDLTSYSNYQPEFGYNIINNTFFGDITNTMTRALHNLSPLNTILNNTFIGYPNAVYYSGIDIMSHNVFKNNTKALHTPFGAGIVSNNDFIGNDIGIDLNLVYECVLDVKYNNFIANDIAINFGKSELRNVSFNNFINNAVIFETYKYNKQVPSQRYCGYNYYGINTTNAFVIQNYIGDICTGYQNNFHPVYVAWWPWYNALIDFSANVELIPYGNGSHLVHCVGDNSHSDLVNGTRLSPIWINDLILTADESPYYIISDTLINYNFIVEPSVEVIFAAGYKIFASFLGGSVQIGKSICNETMQYNEFGLYDTKKAVYISGSGLFKVNYPNSRITSEVSYICNAQMADGKSGEFYYFEFWFHGIFIDNCEFLNMNPMTALRFVNPDNSSRSSITDSLFNYGMRSIIISEYSGTVYPDAGQLLMHHNKFLHITDYVIRGYKMSVFNNVFENEGTNYADAILAYSTNEHNITNNTIINFGRAIYYSYGDYFDPSLEGNTFINNSIGIDIGQMEIIGLFHIHYNTMINNGIAIQDKHESGSMEVKYNMFITNNVSIVFLDNQPKIVQYNNFIDNNFTFVLKDTQYADCSLNWNGITTNITDPSLIQNKILDGCTPNGYDGKIIFWPYFDGPLFFNDIQNLPALYNINYTNCTSLNTKAQTISGQPTRSPSSLSPTTKPTANPTSLPSVAPSAPTTIAPSAAPTISTQSPTLYPTIDPTNDPTIDPTVEPTADPTNIPTNDPTIDPSMDPTEDPTIEPTKDPSFTPTFDPTIDPTSNPSTEPSSTPTSAPSSSPTLQPLSFAQILDVLEVDHKQLFSGVTSEMLVSLALGSIAIIILIIAILTKRSDDQDYEAVVLYILQCFDLYSDIILAALLYNYYLHAQSSVLFEDKQRDFLALLCWVSVLSVFVPYFLNIFAAIRIISKISRERNIPTFTKDYFESNTSLYALGVLLNGGCYTALAFLNSKLFNSSFLNSGLSYYKLRQFEHFKIFNTVLLENMPQIAVQGLAFYEFGSQTSVVFGSTIWASFITSFLSLLMSSMVWCLRRTGNNDYFRITLQLSILDVSHHTKHTVNDKYIDVVSPTNKDQYEHNAYFMKMVENSRYRKKLGIQISTYFGITSTNMQILSAYRLQKQLKVNAIFRCNKHESHSFEPSKLETSASCIAFVDLLQNIYGIRGSLLSIQMKVYPMDEIQPTKPTIIMKQKEAEIDAYSLLKQWKLDIYWSALEEHGFTEIVDWKYLIQDTEKLKAWGLKEGHILQFKRKYIEQFQNKEDCALQIELQQVKEEEGDDIGMRDVKSYLNEIEGDARNETVFL